MKNRWTELADGGSDQWLWVARDGGTYIFVEIIDLPSYCGSDATSQWCASVSTVDLIGAHPQTIADAISSCGYEDEPEIMDACIRILVAGTVDGFTTPGGSRQKLHQQALSIAEMMHSYGAKSPMWEGAAGTPEHDCETCKGSGWVADPEWAAREDGIEHDSECSACEGYGRIDTDNDEDGEAFQGLKREAMEQGKALLNTEHREEQLDSRIVNGLGQTAREYADGIESLWSTLRDIKSNLDATPEQKLVLKIYQGAGTTLGAGPVPSDIQETDNE